MQSKRFPAIVKERRPYLTHRRKQVLALLLRGGSEKTVATKLGLSRDTVHCYVKALYEIYRVGTRAELFAKVIGPRSVPVDDLGAMGFADGDNRIAI